MPTFKVISKREDYLIKKGIDEETLEQFRKYFADLKGNDKIVLEVSSSEDYSENKIIKASAYEVAEEIGMKDKLRFSKVKGKNAYKMYFSSKKKRQYNKRRKEEVIVTG